MEKEPGNIFCQDVHTQDPYCYFNINVPISQPPNPPPRDDFQGMAPHKDEKDRPTVFEHLPEGMPRVISVGRLDLNSEGLLLLTNNGELSRRLELPSNGWARRYKVRVHGPLDDKKLNSLQNGIEVDGVKYGSIKVEVETVKGTNAWLLVTLSEGKNREIRRVMKAIGLEVNRLIRLSYGPFQLGSLRKGEVREIPQKVLKEQLGAKFPL